MILSTKPSEENPTIQPSTGAELAEVLLFIEENFQAATSMSESDLQLSTLEIVNRLKDHFGEISVADLHAELQFNRYKEINLVPGDLKPVWLLKSRK